MAQLVLASGSSYRRALLQRLVLPFTWQAPEIIETPRANETASQLTERLALAKARALQARFTHHLIIGSDQVLAIDGQLISKPGSHDAAVEQLRMCSGQTIEFTTSLCLLNSLTGKHQLTSQPFQVTFRELDDASIERYLQHEQPYDCAGSFKAEGLGISLFSAMHGNDPTSLIGLPLIALCSMLRHEGVALP